MWHTMRQIAKDSEWSGMNPGTDITCQMLFERSSDALFFIDEETIIDCNQAALDMFGCVDKQQVMGQRLVDFSPVQQPDGNPSEEGLHTIIATAREKGNFRFEWVHKRVSGELFSVEALLTAIPVHNTIIFYGVWRDISTRRKTEEKMWQLYRAVEQSPVSIVITDTNGNIEYVNPKFVQATGYTREEALGQNPRVLKSGEFPAESYQQLWELISSGQEWHGEFHNKRKDGSFFWEFASISPITNDKGGITHFLAVKEDITDRKQMEAALNHAYHNLKMLNDQLQQELSMARRIQQALLLPPKPEWDSLDVQCYSMPARDVGGDFYTYYHFESYHLPLEERFAFAVGDVSGKGMPAALLMAISLASFHILITQAFSIDTLLSKLVTQAFSLNAFLMELDRAIEPYTMTTRQNCALVYVEIVKTTNLDTTMSLNAFNAGCIMPILRRQDGTMTWVEASGLPLGVGTDMEPHYQNIHMPLQSGDMIILCSDGLIEAHNMQHEMFGFARLEQAVCDGPNTSAEAMLLHLRSELDAFVGDAEHQDDVTVVVVKV